MAVTVDVLQFVLPSGMEHKATTDLPDEASEDYKNMVKSGCRFEAEILTTGEVSVTISDGDQDIDISVTSNGPEVPAGMVEMLKRRLWIEP
jgi:anti-sigma regulatory factor (Ser/Thr protein kinase)